MTACTITTLAAAALVCMGAPCQGQQPQPPPVRQLGPIINVTSNSLAAITTAVQVAGGRVYVNDVLARRVLLFDSALTSSVVVLDSSGSTANAYGSRPGTLLPYRGDSVLFITPATLSMLVLSPEGRIARVMAMPPAGNGMPALIGSIFGTPGFDARGRLVYFSPVRLTPQQSQNGPTVMEPADSAFIVRFDFATRTLDTAGAIRIARSRSSISRDDHGHVSVMVTAFPPMTVDDWAVASDGSIAVVRGRDYHVDWLNPDGTWTSLARMPYSWEHLNDDEKTALIDSTVTAMQTNMDSVAARVQRGAASGTGPRVEIRGGPGGPGARITTMPKTTAIRPELADVADYRPPFRQGSVRADADGNLWIRTNKTVDGRPVFDVINRRGQLVDRLQLPQFRTIAGFGPGIVYLGVRDSVGVMHLERARIR